MASSIHADDFLRWQGPGLLNVERTPIPTSPYGASKVAMEALGRHYAEYHNLEAVCIRFGAVRLSNVPPEDEARLWLSNNDAVGLVRHALVADLALQKFTIVYGVSDNVGRVHDSSNNLGWNPQDGWRGGH